MAKRKLKKIGNEGDFERHFVHQLDVVGKYRVREGKAIDIDKSLCLFFNDLEDFLERTQEASIRQLKSQLNYGWRDKFAERFRQELQKKRLFEVLKDGIDIQGTHLDLLYFYPQRTGNTAQQKLAAKNRFTAVRQYYFGDIGKAQNNSIDIVLLLNGFAIVTIELKNEGTSGGVETAVQQYLERPVHLPIFQQPFLHLAVSNEAAKMATLFSDPTAESDFRDFNKEQVNIPPNKKEYPVHYLYQDILLPQRLLNYIESYLYTKGDERKWIFPRFHQQRATRLVVDDLKKHFRETGELDQRYLIQHSTGSGKSNTILWMAQNLRNAYVGKELLFDSIIILTDRVNLDDQISKDFQQAILSEGVANYAESTADLKEALEKGLKVIVSTIHKFSYLKGLANQTGKRVGILIDEAHRSQGGNLHDAVTETFESDEAGILPEAIDAQEKVIGEIARKRFPNMAFVALTATPSPATLKHFGKKVKSKEKDGKDKYVPHDVYSMEQAIAEGYIMDVAQRIYAYDTLYQLNKQVESKKEYLPLQVRRALHQKAYEDSEIIKKKCRMMIKIFHNESAGKLKGRAKAMVVSSSRLAAVKYKVFMDEELARQNLPYQTLIAFSDKINWNDTEYTETSMNKSLNILNEKIEDVFESNDNIRFLIVANKFQTGYDEPLLHTMFLDKPLRGRNAVQTLSRLNRIHPDKKDTLAVDFTGSYKEIMKAYKFYQKTVTTSKETDPNMLIKLKDALFKYGVFTLQDMEYVVEAVKKDEAILIPGIVGMLYNIKTRLEENLEEEKQNEFRTLVNRYVASFNYIKTLYRIPSGSLWDFQIFLIHLNAKLTNRDPNSLRRDIEDVKVSSYVITQPKIDKVEDDDDENSGGGGGNTGGDITRVKVTKTVVEVIQEINLKFAEMVGTEGTAVIGDFINVVVHNSDLKEIISSNATMDKEVLYQRIIRDRMQDLLQTFIMDGIMNDKYKPEMYNKIVNKDVMPQVNRMAYGLMRG